MGFLLVVPACGGQAQPLRSLLWEKLITP
jgi:hypothetical protein